jgi:hydrogenase maturation protease
MARDTHAMGNQAVLVVGIGTRYRTDDAAGLIAAERLRAQGPAAVSIVEHEGEGVSLLERLQGWEAAILIDAMSSGASPGTIQRFEAEARPLPARIFRHSTHAISVADAVELGRALGQLPRSLIVFGIEGHDFEAGVGLSPEVEWSLQQVVEQAIWEIRRIQARKNDRVL